MHSLLTGQKPSKELAFALKVANEAGVVALRHFETGIRAEMKADNTPVTAADTECEKIIREALSREFPDDAILGEEEGETNPKVSNGRRWIIDPIDGTYNFARGVGIWSILLALEVDGEVVLGVIHAPAMNDTFWAERGHGAWKNGKALKVSDISHVADAMFTFGAPSRILHDGYWSGLQRVIEATYRQRGFGDYLNFAHVFEGTAEAAFETGLKSWDIAPMKIIAEEAGGRFSDLQGGASVHTGRCLVSNGRVHDQILQLLRN